MEKETVVVSRPKTKQKKIKTKRSTNKGSKRTAKQSKVKSTATITEVQLEEKETTAKRRRRYRSHYFGTKNFLKVNLPNLAFGNVTLNYERMVNKQHTVSVHLGYLRPQKPFFALHNLLNLEDDLALGTMSGFTATAEYRFYQNQQGAGRGFYVAPYVRYADYDLAVNTVIVDNYTETNTSVSTIGVGGQVGMQWLVNDQISIDLGILGLAIQSYNLKSTFKTIDEPVNFDEIEDRVQRAVEGYPFVQGLDFVETEEELSLKMPFLFGGARAYLTVGYKF
ncbi:MAG: DUF3575 domain-containing protein [Bacteroidota bacterium]